MKTSNKLLIGLFVFIVLGMIIANYAIKKDFDKMSELNLNRVQQNNPFVNISIHSESSDSDSEVGLVLNKSKVLLSIDRNTTNQQLSDYQTKLKEININLNIDKIELSSENKIKFIKISVDCNDGFNGSVSQTLKGDEKIGFYRIYDKNAPSPFGMSPEPAE